MTLTGVQGWMLGGQSRLTYSQSSNFSQLLTESEVFGCFLMQSTVFLGACGKFPSWQRSCLFHFNYLFGMHLGLKKQPCGCMHIAYRELESWYMGWKISSTTKPYKIWKSFTFNGIGTASTYGIAKLYNWCTVYKWIWSLEIYIGTCTGPTTNMFLYSLPFSRFSLSSRTNATLQARIGTRWVWPDWSLTSRGVVGFESGKQKRFPKKHFLVQKNHRKLDRAICSDKHAICCEIVRFVELFKII